MDPLRGVSSLKLMSNAIARDADSVLDRIEDFAGDGCIGRCDDERCDVGI